VTWEYCCGFFMMSTTSITCVHHIHTHECARARSISTHAHSAHENKQQHNPTDAFPTH